MTHSLKNIEHGWHTMWPDKWLHTAKAELGRELRNAEGPHGERIAICYTAIVTEIERRQNERRGTAA